MFKIAPRIVPITRVFTALTALIMQPGFHKVYWILLVIAIVTKMQEIQGTQRTNESTLHVNVASSCHVERPLGRERIKWTTKMELDLLTCDQKAHHLHSSLECPLNPNGRRIGVMELRRRFWNEMGYEGLNRNAQQLRDKLAHIQKSTSIDGNRIYCEMDTQSRESNRELETMTLDENTSELTSPIGISHGNDEPENLLETLSEPLKLVNTKSKEIFETIVKDLGNYGNREESTFVRKKPSKHELKSLSLIADNLVVSDPLTEPTQTLWEINCSVYSVATAWKVCNDEIKNSRQKEEPKWKKIIQSKVATLRKEISQITSEIKRLREHKRMSERQKYNRMWMSKQLGDKVLSISNLSELNEKKKHQIRIEKSKMKSQELRYQRQRVNQLYAKDQGKVFRKFREAIKKDIDNEKPTVPQFNNDQLRPETNITKEEYERFWTPIWGNAQEFEHGGTLVNEFDKAVSSRISHQSTEEIKVPKKMVTDKVKRCRNWSAPGKDKICNYWIKGLGSMHELLGRVLEQFINRQIAIPIWFTGGRTVMLNKDGEESAANKRPITCLNTMYKLFTKIIGTFLINHNMKHDLIQLDQHGGKARSLGSIDNLFIDKAVLEDCINNCKNLSCAWYDVRKAYDSVSHQWILKCLEIHRVPKNLCDFIRRLIISWNVTLEVRTDKGLEFIGPIDILRGILQGDSFCVTLFIMGLNPVAWYLRSTEGYKMSTMKEKITHLLFVDDL